MSLTVLISQLKSVSLIPKSQTNICARHYAKFQLPDFFRKINAQQKKDENLKSVAKLKDAEAKSKNESDDMDKPTIRLKKLKEKYKVNPPQLMEFFDNYSNWGEDVVKSGREWRVDELRLKSNLDLHKLWYILYKERNMLLTMLEESRDQVELFPSPERLDKVEQSMLNIEEVVKERNKSYYQLEVGANETGLRPSVFRRDTLGIHKYMSCSEHLIPYWMNAKFRHFKGPGHGKNIDSFILKYRENQTRKRARKVLEQWTHVRQLLRRFPDLNTEELKYLYPKVPVDYLKENLDFFEDRQDKFFFGRKGVWKTN